MKIKNNFISDCNNIIFEVYKFTDDIFFQNLKFISVFTYIIYKAEKKRKDDNVKEL